MLRDSQYDLHTISNYNGQPHPGDRLYQEQEGAFYPQTVIPGEIVVSIHEAPDGNLDILDKDSGSVVGTIKRNGLPRLSGFIWEDSC